MKSWVIFEILVSWLEIYLVCIEDSAFLKKSLVNKECFHKQLLLFELIA